ncbi:GDP-mannose 4,6-dehydratase [Candidatus Woesearchaeota archaeon]|nr:GDP-mannose 4,6-dehydratase [Candidatus Woesearchaeota archaeon]
MKLLVTGGAGFIGSHVAEIYAEKDYSVTVFDNLSRSILLNKEIKNLDHNWNYLGKFRNVERVRGDIRNKKEIEEAAREKDFIIHTAAQTAVTTSITNPEADFTTNALGTFNVLEAARKNDVKAVVYCSTNKVFGDNVNKINVKEGEKRYSFGESHEKGISETFDIDLCEHTPYGCSKLTGDMYVQDYAHLYGIRTGVFRMSCIYGTRQFGVEDQGWVAWFTIATVLEKPITIYGDGKQVRDVLYVTDLVDAYDRFLGSKIKNGIYNTGGGPQNTISLLELLDFLEKLTGKRSRISFSDWRPSDQKVYISDISKAQKELGWKPKITPEEGVRKISEWTLENRKLF